MDASLVILWAMAIGLGILALHRRGPRITLQSARAAGEQLVELMPRVAIAIIAAGFVGKLLPGDAIGHMIGPDSGIAGIAIASLFGATIPSGPMISFPLVLVLKAAGAGIPQIVGFITAWSVYAWHRVLIYEVTMMGWHFTAIRLGCSVVLPLIAGVMAMGLCQLTGLR